jgi:hypothetical protein
VLIDDAPFYSTPVLYMASITFITIIAKQEKYAEEPLSKGVE